MSEGNNNQRLKILYLYKILFEQTDENHSITMPEIIRLLKNHGISAGRKALYQDIEALKEFGADIVLKRSNNEGYSIVNRDFEIPELVLLAGAVNCSQFFTKRKSQMLIGKLKRLCSVHETERISKNTFAVNENSTDNERIYINIDTIQQAIFEKKQISFKYFDYDLKKQKRYREGKRVCSPYVFTWSDNKYYLIAHYPKYGGISHFRIDKIESVEILPTSAQPKPKDFNLSEYMKSTFSMFSGESETVTLRFEKTLINAVFDHFGRGVKIIPNDEEHFIIDVPVKASHPETFFGWLFQFGTSVEILSPEELKNRYTSMLAAVLEKAGVKPH